MNGNCMNFGAFQLSTVHTKFCRHPSVVLKPENEDKPTETRRPWLSPKPTYLFKK